MYMHSRLAFSNPATLDTCQSVRIRGVASFQGWICSTSFQGWICATRHGGGLISGVDYIKRHEASIMSTHAPFSAADCEHCFCLNCIRKWRGSTKANKTIRWVCHCGCGQLDDYVFTFVKQSMSDMQSRVFLRHSCKCIVHSGRENPRKNVCVYFLVTPSFSPC